MGCNESLPVADVFLVKHQASKCLADGFVDNDKPLQLCMKERMFSWSGDSFKIKKEDGTEFMQVQGKVMTMRDRMTLKDMDNKPIAVCIKKVFSLAPSFYIYGLRAPIEGQAESGETEDGMPLYSWAKAKKDVCAMPQTYTLCMATGNDTFEDGSYGAEPPGFCSPKLSVKKNGSGAALIDRAVFQFECKNSYKVTVAPGIDPVLMVAFVACVDELKEEK
mmetsp:Transcript_50472/g.110107  ORF Transcript_50472/g.110107 Transcript_50472/m.110107 type:complete len:220 (-) Transcript_50472:134-793(-)